MGYIINDTEEVTLEEGDIVIRQEDGWDDILELLTRQYQEQCDSEATAETIIKELQAYV